MDVSRVLHMNIGEGNTSYAKNSVITNMFLSETSAMKQSTVLDFYTASSPESLSIAELGCSSGPNALVFVSDTVEVVMKQCRLLERNPPEFQLLLNDLYMTDFNIVFKNLPEFYNKLGFDGKRCFVHGVPGSFYGRLFVTNSLHIVHSSMCLHFLSRVPEMGEGSNLPLNIGNIYLSKTTHPSISRAYFTQFESDFSLFLKCRYEEMVTGGRMILSFQGRRNQDPATKEDCFTWELLSQALRTVASEGLITKEMIDTFNLPYYPPSLKELKDVITRFGYFDICVLDAIETHVESGKSLAKLMRSVSEPMLVNHFGEDVMDKLFNKYNGLLEEYFSKNKVFSFSVILSLVKK